MRIPMRDLGFVQQEASGYHRYDAEPHNLRLSSNIEVWTEPLLVIRSPTTSVNRRIVLKESNDDNDRNGTSMRRAYHSSSRRHRP